MFSVYEAYLSEEIRKGKQEEVVGVRKKKGAQGQTQGCCSQTGTSTTAGQRGTAVGTDGSKSVFSSTIMFSIVGGCTLAVARVFSHKNISHFPLADAPGKIFLNFA